MLRLYDTAERAKVDFVPRRAGAVSMYVCGPTPYDSPHLGHGRQAVVFDTIRRLLGFLGYDVHYVSNVTDIEDKIIERAHEREISEPELVRIYEADYWQQMDRLNVLRPDDLPHATEFIEQMLALIGELVAAGRGTWWRARACTSRSIRFPATASSRTARSKTRSRAGRAGRRRRTQA